MAELFGSPTGELIFNQEERSALQHALQSEEALGRLAMQPVDLRKKQVDLEKSEIDLAQEKEFTRLLQESGSGMEAAAQGQPVNLETTMDQLATKAASAGMIDRAGKLAKSAADIRASKNTAANQKVQAELNGYKAAIAQAEMIGQVLGGVTDQASWDAANMQLQMATGQPSPFANIPYNPKVIERLNAATLSGKERAMLDMRKTEQEATRAYRNSMLSHSAARIEQAAERDRAAQEERERKAKAGGGSGGVVGRPSSEELKEVQRQMRLADIDTAKISPDSLRSTTLAVASRAKEMQRANKALGSSEALAQAFAEAQANGDLNVETVGGTTIAGIQVGGEKKFKTKEKSKAITQALPSDRAALKTGVIYNTARGPAKYLGNGRFASVEQ
jgi:hypothetical protein